MTVIGGIAEQKVSALIKEVGEGVHRRGKGRKGRKPALTKRMERKNLIIFSKRKGFL